MQSHDILPTRSSAARYSRDPFYERDRAGLENLSLTSAQREQRETTLAERAIERFRTQVWKDDDGELRIAPWALQYQAPQLSFNSLPVKEWQSFYSCSIPAQLDGPIPGASWWLDIDSTKRIDTTSDYWRPSLSISVPHHDSYLWMAHESFTREIDQDFRRDTILEDQQFRKIHQPPLLGNPRQLIQAPAESNGKPESDQSRRCMLAEMPPEIMDKILGYLLPTGCVYQFLVCNMNPRSIYYHWPRTNYHGRCYLVVNQLVPHPCPGRGDTVETARLALAATNQAFHAYVCARFYGENTFVFHPRLDYLPVYFSPTDDGKGNADSEEPKWNSWVRPLAAGPTHDDYLRNNDAASAAAAAPPLILNPMGPLTGSVGRYIKSAVVVVTVPNKHLRSGPRMRLLNAQLSNVVNVLSPKTEGRRKMDRLVMFTGMSDERYSHLWDTDGPEGPRLKVEVCPRDKGKPRLTVGVEAAYKQKTGIDATTKMFNEAVEPLTALTSAAESLTLCGQWVPRCLHMAASASAQERREKSAEGGDGGGDECEPEAEKDEPAAVGEYSEDDGGNAEFSLPVLPTESHPRCLWPAPTRKRKRSEASVLRGKDKDDNTCTTGADEDDGDGSPESSVSSRTRGPNPTRGSQTKLTVASRTRSGNKRARASQ